MLAGSTNPETRERVTTIIQANVDDKGVVLSHKEIIFKIEVYGFIADPELDISLLRTPKGNPLYQMVSTITNKEVFSIDNDIIPTSRRR